MGLVRLQSFRMISTEVFLSQLFKPTLLSTKADCMTAQAKLEF